MTTDFPTLGGVLPVLATPFLPGGEPDAEGLRGIARYAIAAGADGVVYPGVASEYDLLTPGERSRLTAIVAAEARGRVPLVVGGSAPDPATTEVVARQAREQGAAALMVMAPKSLVAAGEAIA